MEQFISDTIRNIKWGIEVRNFSILFQLAILTLQVALFFTGGFVFSLVLIFGICVPCTIWVSHMSYNAEHS